MDSDGSIQAMVAELSLRVRDLEASISFYCGIFGCERVETESSRAAQVRLCTQEPFSIHLVQGRSLGAVSTMSHFSLRVKHPQDVDRVYDRAVAHHARAMAPRDVDDRRHCWIFDPDGHKIEVFVPLAADG